MERPARLPLLTALLAVVLRTALLAVVLGAAPATVRAAAAVFTTQTQALAEAFPRAKIERRAFVLEPAQIQAVESRARVQLGTRLVVAYSGWRADSLVGTAFFDTRTVRTMPAVLMVVVAPDTTVAQVEVLAFHEPPDYRPPARWLGLFGGRKLDPQLWPARDIRNLSGASLTARAVTESVRLALSLYGELAPELARRVPKPEAHP